MTDAHFDYPPLTLVRCQGRLTGDFGTASNLQPLHISNAMLAALPSPANRTDAHYVLYAYAFSEVSPETHGSGLRIEFDANGNPMLAHVLFKDWLQEASITVTTPALTWDPEYEAAQMRFTMSTQYGGNVYTMSGGLLQLTPTHLLDRP